MTTPLTREEFCRIVDGAYLAFGANECERLHDALLAHDAALRARLAEAEEACDNWRLAVQAGEERTNRLVDEYTRRLTAETARAARLGEALDALVAAVETHIATEACQDPREDGRGGWHECGGCWPCRAKQVVALLVPRAEERP